MGDHTGYGRDRFYSSAFANPGLLASEFPDFGRCVHLAQRLFFGITCRYMYSTSNYDQEHIRIAAGECKPRTVKAWQSGKGIHSSRPSGRGGKNMDHHLPSTVYYVLNDAYLPTMGEPVHGWTQKDRVVVRRIL